MDYEGALAYLSLYTNYERELRYPYDGWSMNLERVRSLLAEFSRPEQNLAVLHIAGTKGKGSTAAMIESMARAAGKKTGLFTSPHLLDFRERIRISGEPAQKNMVARGVERLIPAAEKTAAKKELGPLTYFEVLTALAFLIFAEEKTNLVILETGLGGRFDATNVCDPLLAVLTPVSLDHTDILGSTLSAIAWEKAMIIKPGKPAVIAPQPPEAAAVFHKRCVEVSAPEILVENRYTWRRRNEEISGQWFDLVGARKLENLFLPLAGDHQLLNAAAAVTSLDVLAEAGIFLPDEAVRKGLAALKWPARFERVRKKPDVILDGAHNASSAAFLRQTVQRFYPGRRVIAVIGLGRDKDVEGFCRELGPCLETVIITSSRTMKAAEAERITAAFHGFPLVIRRTGAVADALELAFQEAGNQDVILVTGSFYVISEALARLQPPEE